MKQTPQRIKEQIGPHTIIMGVFNTPLIYSSSRQKNQQKNFRVKLNHNWHQWLTPIILATQEAEIKKITV
jgi:hypothetical protein